MLENDPLTVRLAEFMELEETRDRASKTLEAHQTQVKRSFDKRTANRSFKEGDLVLKWDEDKEKPGKHTKFDASWSGPYIITSCKEANAFPLSKLDGKELFIPVNGIHLKTFL